MTLAAFVEAQAPIYAQALAELRAGQKQSHWMWFIFPQIAGLGQSPMSRAYALHSLQEAGAYLDHPILGPRLRQCCRALRNLPGRSAQQIFGSPDDMKFRSCLTLFAQAAPQEAIFRELLEKYFAGAEDEATLALLRKVK